jgi:hypothetical protein
MSSGTDSAVLIACRTHSATRMAYGTACVRRQQHNTTNALLYPTRTSADGVICDASVTQWHNLANTLSISPGLKGAVELEEK